MPSSASLMTVVIRLRQSSWLGSAQTTRFGEGSSTGSEKGNAAIDRPNLLSSLRGSSLFMLRRLLPNEWRRSTNLFGKSSFGCYFYYSFLQSLIRSDHEHFNAFRLDPAVSMTYRKKLHSATSIRTPSQVARRLRHRRIARGYRSQLHATNDHYKFPDRFRVSACGRGGADFNPGGFPGRRERVTLVVEISPRRSLTASVSQFGRIPFARHPPTYPLVLLHLL